MELQTSNEKTLSIQGFVMGEWQTNCFVLSVDGDGSRQCWIVDAGFYPDQMIEWIREQGLKPSRILLTHAHLDHIGGIPQLREAFGSELPVFIHPNEKKFLTDPMLNLSTMAMVPDVDVGDADGFFEDGDELQLDGIPWKVLFTPGHSPGGVTFYQPDSGVALVGDTLFAGSVGRMDFPTSDGPQLFKSIREQLFELPDETQVFAGHGPATTIGIERKTNPYVGEHASAMGMP